MVGITMLKKVMFMIINKINRINILIETIVMITQIFNNSEVQKESLITILKPPTTITITSQMGTIMNKLICSICRKSNSSIHHRRTYNHRIMKIQHAFITVRLTISATTLWWILDHRNLEKRKSTNGAIKLLSMTNLQKIHFKIN